MVPAYLKSVVVAAVASALWASSAPLARGAAKPPLPDPLATAKPCAIERFAAPSDGVVAEFESASCIALDGERRLCKVRSNDDGPGALIYLDGANERWRWPANGYLGATADFALYRVPAPGGAKRWVIANHWSSGNGLGVESTDLLYVDAFESGSRPLAFTVEDFGPSTFVQLPAADGCAVLATEWFPDDDRKRGPGMYFGAQMFRPVGGHLAPLAEGSAVARRLLGSFESERGKDMWDGPEQPWAIGDPLKWLRGPRAEPRSNPRGARPVAKRERGTVEAIAYDDVTLPPHVTIALVAGGELKVRERYFPPESCEPSATTHERPIARVGDEPSHVLFPQSYRPADADALVGRSAELVTYRDPDATSTSCPPRILWIGAASAAAGGPNP